MPPDGWDETEFNRYYIRRHLPGANTHGTKLVVVYRDTARRTRPSSQDMVGREYSAPRILANMRGSQGMDTERRGSVVNSGLSVRCG